MGVNTRNMYSCLQKYNKLNKLHLVGQLLHSIHDAQTHVYKIRNIHVTAISTPYICPYIPKDKNHAPYQCQHLGTAAVLPTPHALLHTPVWEQCHGYCLFQSPHPCRRKVLENMVCLKDTAQHLDIRSLITYHLLSPTSKLLPNLRLQASKNSSVFRVSKVFSNLKLHVQVSNSFRFSDDSNI